MNELDTFTINFVTEGIDKLLDGMDKLNKQMDKIDTGFVKAGSKGDAFFDKFIGWGLSLGALISGFIGLRQVIREVFTGGQEIINLHTTADLTGHTAKEVETLGLALYKYVSLNSVKSLDQGYNAAGRFFDALNNLRLDESRLKTSNQVMEELLGYGQSTAILADDSDIDIVRKIRDALTTYSKHDPKLQSAEIKRLFSALGVDYETMMPLLSLSDEKFNAVMKQAGMDAWRYTPEKQKEAIELEEARRNLTITWKQITDELRPAVIELTNDFERLLKQIKPIIDDAIKLLDRFVKFFGGEDEATIQNKKQQEGGEALLKWYKQQGDDVFLSTLPDMKALAYAKQLAKNKNIPINPELLKAIDYANEVIKQTDSASTYLNNINNGKTNNLEINNYQTFNGYDRQDVGDAAKNGAKEGTEKGSYYIIRDNL